MGISRCLCAWIALVLVSCAPAAHNFKLSNLDKEKGTRQFVGKEFVLGSSVYFTDFFGESDKLFVEARPFDIVELWHHSGEKVAVGVPSDTIIPAGTAVKVKEIIYPASPLMAPFQEGRSALAPTAHPWLIVERTSGEVSNLPLVFVLSREIATLREFDAEVGARLKSPQWVTSWLTLHDPLLLDAIYKKQPVVGMTLAGVQAALGPSRNDSQREASGVLDFTADYGDLQVTLQGKTVVKVESQKALAAAAQEKAQAEAEKARIAAEEQAAKQAAEEAVKKAEADEALKLREAEAAKEKTALAEASAQVRAAEQAKQDKERQTVEENRAAEAKAKVEADVAAQREAELQARLTAAKREKEEAEKDRERKVREAELAAKVAEAEAAAVAAKKKAEADAVQAQANALAERKRTRDALKRAETAAAAARKKADTAEKKAQRGRTEIDAAQKRVDEVSSAAGPRKVGVKLQDVSPQLAAALGIGEARGAYIVQVKPNSEADRAGILANDIIVKAGGEAVAGPSALLRALDNNGVRAVEVEVVRQGKTLKLTLVSEEGKEIAIREKALTRVQEKHQGVLAAADTARALADKQAQMVAELRERLEGATPATPRKIGLMIDPVSPQLAAALGLKPGQGAFISKVKEDGDAGRGGVQPSDIVLEVNGVAVAGPDKLTEMVGSAMSFESIELMVLRKGARIKIIVPAALAKAESDGSDSGSRTQETGGKKAAPAVPEQAESAAAPVRTTPDPRSLDLSSAIEDSAEAPRRGPIKSK